MTAVGAGLLIAAFSPNPGAQLFGALLMVLGGAFVLLKRAEQADAEVDS